MNERRHESRFLCADLVKVEWLTDSPGGHSANTVPGRKKRMESAEAVLEDISMHGACVQVEEPVPVGTPILISTCGPDANMAGQVSYCVFRDYGYFVGIRFAPETLWSSGVFLPQHLTDLTELAIAPR